MTMARISTEPSGGAVSRVPAAVRAAIVAAGALVFGGALYLWAERGAALLLDLAHMGSRFLCL